MAQFDIYKNKNPQTKQNVPYLLDVQAELFDALASRVVIPLISAKKMEKPAKYLNPHFKIEGAEVVMSTTEIAGIPKKLLGEKITSLKTKRTEILAALDFLFTGF